MAQRSSDLYIGKNPIKPQSDKVEGSYVERNGEMYYRIAHFQSMAPFFMTLVSSADQWLFVGSNGGITAGRKNPDNALFPYYTVDKILESAALTGSKTLFKVNQKGKQCLWEPFSRRHAGAYELENNLYKNTLGDTLIFEEINHDLQLCFTYSWCFAPHYGFVKTATLRNLSKQAQHIEVLDGVQNLLPYGINLHLQNNYSNLTDAYKKSELSPQGLGIFSLSSMVVDKAEPSEALKATTVWTAGLKAQKRLLSSQQLDDFRRGATVRDETLRKAAKGAFFVNSTIALAAKDDCTWHTVADVNKTPAQVANLDAALKQPEKLIARVKQDIARGSDALKKLVSMADGLQVTRDQLTSNRHFSNVLFNVMRGGIFAHQYQIDRSHFYQYAQIINPQFFDAQRSFFEQLPESFTYPELLAQARSSNNAQLYRISCEYLPLTFSRRHGDPSRPWNYFTIDPLDENGDYKLQYEGNWRDIFQNWEALAYSYPCFIEGMVTKFLNATTIDGYNPYRINQEGIDWEVIDPEDPWSYIGYWGDHQIIYLQKLLEHFQKHYPDKLEAMLQYRGFVYANVPYRIKSYPQIVENPTDTIEYDHEMARHIEQRVAQQGADGKLVWNAHNEPLTANMVEKIMVTTLAKLYNFIPEAGIWLNTQRPEWNDANNALVGNGVSMVTLSYLRRFLAFNVSLLQKLPAKNIEIHEPVHVLFTALDAIFKRYKENIDKGFGNTERRQMTDELGIAGSQYREAAYTPFAERLQGIKPSQLSDFYELALRFLDASISKNKRADGLYHAYNTVQFEPEALYIGRLQQMLEGQVAVLSAGTLSPEEATALLDNLKSSAMYRADQYSYMLYPDKELPAFLDKNIIDPSVIEKSKLWDKLAAKGDTRLAEKDDLGHYHFNGNLHNAKELKTVLHQLEEEGYQATVKKEYDLWMDAFEAVFNHRAFTGRSGTFYSYEGLGSIYWHMVSKLLLATHENLNARKKSDHNPSVFGKLVEHYYEIKAGIGINKSPAVYGAFPTDAYSHTPSHGGAKQPGMTGQVKEDILSRWAELGLVVQEGALHIKPTFLREQEFIKNKDTISYLNAQGQWTELELPPQTLAFTYCGVPFLYHNSGINVGIEVYFYQDKPIILNSLEIPAAISEKLFARTGEIKRLEVHLPPEVLL